MKINFQEIANRITGISCPFFGISWEPKESNRKVARKIIANLEDRRVLYSPYILEIPSHCIKSIHEIRQILTNELSKMQNDDELSNNLRGMRSACRKFLNKVERIENSLNPIPGTTINDWIFLSSLGELRGVFGIFIAKLAVSYGLSVEEELAEIIPLIDKENSDLHKKLNG